MLHLASYTCNVRLLYNITSMLLCKFNKSVKVWQFFKKGGQNEAAGGLVLT